MALREHQRQQAAGRMADDERPLEPVRRDVGVELLDDIA
jgi:hypothetical protein